MKKPYLLYLFVTLTFLLSACIADPQNIESCVQGEQAGFWLGLWHGVISPVTFILSLFMDNIEVFAYNNNGGWYIFGFLLGVGAFTSGTAKGTKRKCC